MTAGFQFDYVFDWTILKYQQSQIATPPARVLVSDQPLWLLVLATGLKIFNVLFISFILFQGPGAGPSSGMPPIAANADRQSGNSACVSVIVFPLMYYFMHIL